MTEPMYKPQPLSPTCPPGTEKVGNACVSIETDGPPPPIPYFNKIEGLSGIGRAMRDKYMAQQAEDAMMRKPLPVVKDEVYKKGGRVKRKADMGHMSHADHVKKHYAVGGYIHHSDHAKKLCGGGYMKGKK